MKSDSFDAVGAAILANRITAYWRKRGYDVNVWSELVPGLKFEMWQVRSNLVNGLPVR